MSDELEGVLEALEELTSDTTVPQNVRLKISDITTVLKKDSEEVTLRVNKVLDSLEEISNDSNLPSYTRTQIWNISCMLEMI